MRRLTGPRLLAVLVLGVCRLASAQIDLSPLNITNTVTWATGDVVQQTSFCVESFQEAPDKKSSTPIPYAAELSIGGATTPLTLANGAGLTVPVSATWTDTVANTTTALSPGVPTPNTLSGKLAACPGGNNGLLTLTVLNSSLGAMPAGTYSRSFSLEVTNLGSGRSRRAGTVTLSVVIPPVVRIANINDLVLGTFNGVSDLVAADTVCIYKNGGNLYGITATGDDTTTANAFTLRNGTASVPYTVTWQDNVGTVALTAGTQAANRGNANTTSTTCSGGDNATVTVRVTAAALLGGMQPGLYSGVLTLRVVPL